MSEPIHIISLGAGVQSSTMALMAAAGEIGPMPTAAVFADTQAEPASVYKWLDWLEGNLPFPVIRVTRGSLSNAQLTIRVSPKKVVERNGVLKPLEWSKSLIPAFVLNRDGSKGIMGRQCTYDYKVEMLERESRRLALPMIEARKKEKRQRLKLQDLTILPPVVVQWIGISLDEAHRMKPARKDWIVHRWPLIDLEMKRHDCLRWMERNGFPKPPRSACIYCPFHSDREWRRLRDDEPDEFAKAIQFEIDLQFVKRQTDNMGGIPFLHASLKPLSTVDFSSEEERGQLSMFGNECEGMCGV